MKVSKRRITDHLSQVKHLNIKAIKENSDKIIVPTYFNCLLVEPLTAQAERNILRNPYTPTLRSAKHFYALYWFPQSIDKEDRDELPTKYKTRLYNLLKSQELGQVHLSQCVNLPPQDILSLKYTAKQYTEHNEDNDYRDDMEDTACKALAEPPKTYVNIDRVCTAYNTFLILLNPKKNKNKSLYRYLDSDISAFYADCAINYILLHSQIATAENLKYPNPVREVRMPANELRKLIPHNYTLTPPEGVKISYPRENTKRLSKNDTVTLTFSDEYLEPLKQIILKTQEKDSPNSFLKIPMFFLIEALQAKNFGSNGFCFLLWLTAFFRMPKPKILHSLKGIMNETGMDMNHGYNKPLATLQKYFNYMFSLNMFTDISEPIELNPKANQLKLLKTKESSKLKKLSESFKYNDKYIQLTKPTKTKDKAKK